MALEKKKTQYGDLWFLSDKIDVDEIDAKEKEKMEDYVARFEPERKFSFTVDNVTIDTKLFERSPEVTFKSIIPPTDNRATLSAPEISNLIAELKELKARVNRTVALVHNCQRCGASLEIDEHKSIFCCKYCGATYLLGSIQPNSVYN